MIFLAKTINNSQLLLIFIPCLIQAFVQFDKLFVGTLLPFIILLKFCIKVSKLLIESIFILCPFLSLSQSFLQLQLLLSYNIIGHCNTLPASITPIQSKEHQQEYHDNQHPHTPVIHYKILFSIA